MEISAADSIKREARSVSLSGVTFTSARVLSCDAQRVASTSSYLDETDTTGWLLVSPGSSLFPAVARETNPSTESFVGLRSRFILAYSAKDAHCRSRLLIRSSLKKNFLIAVLPRYVLPKGGMTDTRLQRITGYRLACRFFVGSGLLRQKPTRIAAPNSRKVGKVVLVDGRRRDTGGR